MATAGRQRRRRWFVALLAVAAAAVLLASCSDSGPSSSAAVGPGQGNAPPAHCDRVASTGGSDSNPGTVASPWKTAGYMANHLRPGQVGCFRSGTFDFDDQIHVTKPGITLTSYPGERATLRGWLWIAQGANRVTISHLDLDGRSSINSGPKVDAADTVFDDDDVTNYHTEICFILGSQVGGRAVRTVIENSRIHDCGRIPSTNQDHGIYVAHATDPVIRDNWIYNNTDRGIQLYPDSQGARIYGNVIDANGEGIIVSGNGDTASSDNQIYGNVISNSRIRWNVESLWPQGLVGTGNVVRDNCLFATNPTRYYDQAGGVIIPAAGHASGLTESGNRIANPQFVDEGSEDLRLRSSSPCATLLAP